nr:CNT_HP1_G0042520.mRNA.1.CDS.1 [Saccharomyces cerevisiae]
MGAKVSNFMNFVILVAVVSVCNSCVYASSRLIQALGASGQLPSVCSYMDRKGRPLVGIGISGAFGLLGFLVASKKEDEVFTWLSPFVPFHHSSPGSVFVCHKLDLGWL